MSDFESMEAECPDCAFKDAEIERLQCVLAGRRVQQYKDEIERLQSDMDKYHEMVDLFIESLGNKGMSPADIVAEILRLREQNERWRKQALMGADDE